MKTSLPKLSIIMPVYNREKYIQAAVKSILNQTFTNFEFIIINDGSTDKTVKLIEKYNDPRIKLYHNHQNCGIVYSRNYGLSKATGQYIGMFDSDDIALPKKFEKQIKFLEKNTEYGMVGAWVKWINEDGKLTGKGWKLKAPPDEIPAIMFFRNYFIQSTVVIRSKILPPNGYSEGFDIVEDSKMWFDISLNHRVANIHEYLVYYRMHDNNISNLKSNHVANSKKLITHILSKLELTPTDNELNLQLSLKNNSVIKSTFEIKQYENWLTKIYSANKQIKLYDDTIFKKVIFNRWLKVCFKAKRLHIHTLISFLTSPLTKLAL